MCYQATVGEHQKFTDDAYWNDLVRILKTQEFSGCVLCPPQATLCDKVRQPSVIGIYGDKMLSVWDEEHVRREALAAVRGAVFWSQVTAQGRPALLLVHLPRLDSAVISLPHEFVKLHCFRVLPGNVESSPYGAPNRCKAALCEYLSLLTPANDPDASGHGVGSFCDAPPLLRRCVFATIDLSVRYCIPCEAPQESQYALLSTKEQFTFKTPSKAGAIPAKLKGEEEVAVRGGLSDAWKSSGDSPQWEH